jgi:hypothetical protein
MAKIQNLKLRNTPINFEEVGIIKSDENGIFDIPNDKVAIKVVGAIKGFKLVPEPVEVTKEPTPEPKVQEPAPAPKNKQKDVAATKPVEEVTPPVKETVVAETPTTDKK